MLSSEGTHIGRHVVPSVWDPKRLDGDKQLQGTSVVKATVFDVEATAVSVCFLSRYGGGAASKGGSETLPSARAKLRLRPAKSMGHNIYMAVVCLLLLLLFTSTNQSVVLFSLLLLLLVLLLISSSLGVQVLAFDVQYYALKQWGSYDLRLLAFGNLFAFQSFKRFFNESNVASQCSLELVHPCFVLFKVVDVMASQMVCSSSDCEQVG